MKKKIIISVLFFVVSFSGFAQGFYFDIGLGFGKGWTKLNGIDMVDAIESSGGNVDETAIDIGLKAGYGPFGSMPLYIVGELAGMGHRIEDAYNYIQYNSYIIGPGVIFYPVRPVQLGLSLGFSRTANNTDLPGVLYMYDSKRGFAWNVSAAIDLGKRNSGCLIGIKYFRARNTLEVSNAKEVASMVSIFVKYAHRKKPSYL